MSLITEFGEEVIYLFITAAVIVIGYFAWLSTGVSERNLRTLFMVNRRIRIRRRLTNHTQAETIQEGTDVSETMPEEDSNPEMIPNSEQAVSVAKPEASTSNPEGSEEAIIETMDANTNELRQRKNNECTSSSKNVDSTSTNSCSKNEDTNDKKYDITIKLKFLNDDLKSVDGNLKESLDDFKKRHFQLELSENKVVKLIYKGHVLQPDTQTLRTCGLEDDCVVHCLIHNKKSSPSEPQIHESPREGYSFGENNLPPSAENNNQIREWDLGSLLFAMVSLFLLLAWYFRYVYAHMYTVTATIGLILVTGIFSIVVVGTLFPNDEVHATPLVEITLERGQQQQ
nr:transmembrane and ubiquitin-like domain-containing protein 1 isoform X1 [Leptinotarsa decemlineata]XP_023015862.1 transmembrane and ubiquitin-like domain-containing protein 1 isoform X1 [Leptinotarsa decemlineata]